MIYTPEFMEPLFHLIERLDGIPQKEIHHPEGDVLNHTIQVMNIAFRESIDTDLILAAMLHDIGKYENSLGHEKIAVEWLQDYCSPKTLWLIQNHMRIWTYLEGEMKRLGKLNELIKHPWLPELIQLARWDNLGRKPNYKIKSFDKFDILEKLNKRVMKKFEIASEKKELYEI